MKIAIYIDGNINQEYDYIIGVEKGAIKLADQIDVAIADFDSVSESELKSIPQDKLIKLASEKDYTDLEEAIKHALEKTTDVIDVYLPTSIDRIDHLFTNLLLLNKYNIKLIFDNAVAYKGKDIKVNQCKYFSIYNFDKTKIEIKGAKYNLNQEVEALDSRLISNENTNNAHIISEKEIIIIEVL